MKCRLVMKTWNVAKQKSIQFSYIPWFHQNANEINYLKRFVEKPQIKENDENCN